MPERDCFAGFGGGGDSRAAHEVWQGWREKKKVKISSTEEKGELGDEYPPFKDAENHSKKGGKTKRKKDRPNRI